MRYGRELWNALRLSAGRFLGPGSFVPPKYEELSSSAVTGSQCWVSLGSFFKFSETVPRSPG